MGDDGTRQRSIRTVHGRGYRFVATVSAQPAVRRVPAPPRAPLEQCIRFAVTPDGARIAYATTGSGPPLVKAANWMTHLDYEAENPVWRHWLEELSRRWTLVRYDERGCGLSDWDVDRFSFDAWVDDLEVVVEAAGLGRCAAAVIRCIGKVHHRFDRRVPGGDLRARRRDRRPLGVAVHVGTGRARAHPVPGAPRLHRAPGHDRAGRPCRRGHTGRPGRIARRRQVIAER